MSDNDEYAVLLVKKTSCFPSLKNALEQRDLLVDVIEDLPVGLNSPLQALENMWCLRKMGEGLFPVRLGDMDAQGLYLGQVLGQEHKKNFNCLNRLQLANHMYLAKYHNFTFFYYFGKKNEPKWQIKLEPGFSDLPKVTSADMLSVIRNNKTWVNYCENQDKDSANKKKFFDVLDLADALIADVNNSSICG